VLEVRRRGQVDMAYGHATILARPLGPVGRGLLGELVAEPIKDAAE
jgi:hypothetical protein